MFSGDDTFDNIQVVLEGFAKSFSISFINSSTFTCEIDNIVNDAVMVDAFSEAEVQGALKKMKNKKTAGPDSIPAFLLRDCACIFAAPLTKLFNLCLEAGEVPKLWKISKVCPIYKSGDRADISNYRPVSIINNFSKVFEMLLSDRLQPAIRDKLSLYEHGFIKRRSTVTNLTCISQHIAETIDSFTDGRYL